MLDRVGRIPQPWLFLGLALGFGVIAYLASGESVWRGVIGGLAFGVAISVWLRVRTRIFRPPSEGDGS